MSETRNGGRRFLREALAASLNLNGQAGSPLRATTSQYLPAILRTHSLTESMFTFFLEVRWLLRCERHAITPYLRTLTNEWGIIRTRRYPVKLRTMHPGTVTLSEGIMRYIFPNRLLKNSASLSCSFGLFGLSGRSGLFSSSSSSYSTKQTRQTEQTR